LLWGKEAHYHKGNHKMFSLSYNPPIGTMTKGPRGFHVSFDNGYTISVQFGYGNYCSNRRSEQGGDLVSDDAEIAVLNGDGNFIPLSEYDDVIGYQSWDDFQRIFSLVSEGRVDELVSRGEE